MCVQSCVADCHGAVSRQARKRREAFPPFLQLAAEGSISNPDLTAAQHIHHPKVPFSFTGPYISPPSGTGSLACRSSPHIASSSNGDPIVVVAGLKAIAISRTLTLFGSRPHTFLHTLTHFPTHTTSRP